MSKPWMKIALGELGVEEIGGSGDNKRILEYHAVTSLHAKHDSVPWCAAFVSWCLEQSGVPSARSASSQTYRKFGVKLSQPVYGCIVVFEHKANPGTGHVTFFESWDGKYLHCLGGNQADQVKHSNYSDDEVVAYVMPKGY